MQPHRNQIAELAAQTAAGNPRARLQLRKQMETQMVFIVRRTLQTGKAATALDRRILAAARQLDAQPHHPASRDPEQRIRAIADALCGAVMTNLRTVESDRQALAETVVEYAPSAGR